MVYKPIDRYSGGGHGKLEGGLVTAVNTSIVGFDFIATNIKVFDVTLNSINNVPNEA